MILFKNDWNLEENKNAIIDWDTKNKSFVDYVGLLESMGVENRYWPLALLNPDLRGIDPYDPNLSILEKVMIVEEARDNYWYFVREVCRLPSQGSLEPVKFKANRFNLGLYWCFFNHITTFGLIPRQHGKTASVEVLKTWIRDIGGQGTTIALYTKDDQLRTATVKLSKDLADEFPEYFKIRSRLDTNNTETISNKALNNIYVTCVAQASPKNALKLLRGLTIPIMHYDEICYCVNNMHSVPSIQATGNAARKNAELNGGFYGTIFTTTAGYLNTPHGTFAKEIYNESLPWTELLLDAPDRKSLEEVIRKNNRKRLIEANPKELNPRPPVQILLEFNHRQLGVSDEEFLEMIENAKAKGDALDADFLNKWPKGSDDSPLSPETLERMYNSINFDPYVTIENGYMIKWYVSKEEVDAGLPNRFLIMGLDPSEAAGGDDIGMTIVDAYTGRLIAIGKYNETNIIKFSYWIGKLMLRYKKLILVIERRSLGTTILDCLMLLLPKHQEDPFKRIYTRMVDDMEEVPEFKEYLKTPYHARDMQFYYKNKKLVGYTTSGEGRHSRDNIYFRAWNGATTYLADLIYSLDLYDQLANLVYKNNRIDHKPGMHDDLVFAWLLCYWFLTVARNKIFYGLRHDLVLSKIRSTFEKKNSPEEEIRRKDAIILAKLENIKEQIRELDYRGPDLKELEYVYKELSSQLSSTTSENVHDFDSLISELKKESSLGGTYVSLSQSDYKLLNVTIKK